MQEMVRLLVFEGQRKGSSGIQGDLALI